MTSRITRFLGLVAMLGMLVVVTLPSRAYDGTAASQQEQTSVPQEFDAQGAMIPDAASDSTEAEPAVQTQRERYDAQGKKVAPGEALPKFPLRGVSKSACLELHNGPGVTWNITVNFDPNSIPFTITGGTIKGTICGSPKWQVTGGFLRPTLQITAKQTPPVAGCASTVTIVGNFQNPPSYKGTYGFNGSSTMFSHTTLFLGYSPFPCP